MVKKPTMGKALKPKTPRNKIKAELPVVESAVATETQSGIVIGVLMLCAVALLVVFGSSFMAGIVALTNSAPLESAETINDYDPNLLAKPASFKLLYGNIDNVKYFDVYNASVASYGIYKNSDKCLIDVCVGTKCSPKIVTACANGENNCRLQEAFVFNEGNYSKGGTITKVGNWIYNCPEGCSKGACVRPAPVAECTDSDSNAGQNNIFIKGSTLGLIGSVPKTAIDNCASTSTLVEYSCGGGNQIVEVRINCENGCVDGECIPKLEAGDIIRPYYNNDVINLYYYGKDGKRHYIPVDVFMSWGFDLQKIKVISQKQLDLIPVGANLTIRPIGYVSQINGNYYFVMPGGKLKKFENEEAITYFFGENWNDTTPNTRVKNIELNFLANYEILPGLITINDKYPDGSLVSFEGYMGIFYIQDGKRRIFSNTDTFLKNNLNVSLVASSKAASTIDYPDGEEISTIEDQFIYPY